MTSSALPPVSQTAKMVSYHRSCYVDISEDRFSTLWLDDEIRARGIRYHRAIPANEALVTSVQHRFYLESIRQHVGAGPNACIVNFGSGLTMYPYYVAKDVLFIELDTPELSEYKKAKLARWTATEQIPHRNIQFRGCDLRDEESVRFAVRDVLPSPEKYRFLLLLENVTYFLHDSVLRSLLSIPELTGGASKLALDFAPPHAEGHPAFLAASEFWIQECGCDAAVAFFRGGTFFDSLPDWTLDELGSLPDIARDIDGRSDLAEDEQARLTYVALCSARQPG